MRYDRAFTLIEILVIIGIIALFSGLSLAYSNNINAAKKLQGDTKQLVDVLDIAAKKANSADISPSQTSCTTFQGYQVSFSGDTYSLDFLCAPDVPSPQSIQTYSTSAGITLSVSGASPVFYKLLSGGTNGTTTIIITDTTANPVKCNKLVVSSLGVVTETDKSCS